jgi:hypothetical protein
MGDSMDRVFRILVQEPLSLEKGPRVTFCASALAGILASYLSLVVEFATLLSSARLVWPGKDNQPCINTENYMEIVVHTKMRLFYGRSDIIAQFFTGFEIHSSHSGLHFLVASLTVRSSSSLCLR